MKQGITGREFEITDMNEIINILDKCKIVHVGLVDGDEPYVVPMNYGYTLEEGKLTLYLHGNTAGRKLDLMRRNPKVFIEMNCDVQAFDGKMACQYGTSYSSLMGRGLVTVLEDPHEKIEGLSIFMKTQTGKDFQFTEKLVSIVSVMKVELVEYTAKHRPMPKTATI